MHCLDFAGLSIFFMQSFIPVFIIIIILVIAINNAAIDRHSFASPIAP